MNNHFTPAHKAKGYGHDQQATLAVLENGTTISTTADSILTITTTYRHHNNPLHIITQDPIRHKDAQTVTNHLNITTGTLETKTSNAHLFNPTKTPHHAKLAALLDAITQATNQTHHHNPTTLTQLTGEPTSITEPGTTSTTPDGTYTPLSIPPYYLIELTPHTDTTPKPITLPDNTLTKLLTITTLEELPTIYQNTPQTQLTQDLKEILTELPTNTIIIPTSTQTTGLIYPATTEGFHQATQARATLKKLFPTTPCFISKTWWKN